MRGLPAVLMCAVAAVASGATVTGELKQWHQVTLTFDGPETAETAEPNPFTFYRLDVTFTHPDSGQTVVVPGYYAADGQAGETSADSGRRWRVHFAPMKTGKWSYKVSFRKGEMIHAEDDPAAGESAGYMDGQRGTVEIGPTDKGGRDFRGKGLLEYVGKHHLRFAGTGEYFLKCGPDAPETFLAYAGFDGTESRKANVPLKRFEAHVRDWKAGDPSWQDGQGKGIIGALNYLAGKGCNAVSFLTYNAGGDGDNVWPFAGREEKLRYDCSKLDQWQIVFDHAQQNGLYLHMKTQEMEMDNELPTALDGGELGPERKLYYRELIARFGYCLALNWNLGEENTQTTEQRQAMAAYFAQHDPYRHPVVLHTYPGQQEEVYGPLLGGQSELAGVSIQTGWNNVFDQTLEWVRRSAEAGRPWVVANDEQNPHTHGVPPDPGYRGYDPKTMDYDLHDIRRQTLWGNLMAGGAGVEYYFGYQLPEDDLRAEDYRSRDQSWEYGRIAIDFFQSQAVPFQEMSNHDELIASGDGHCLALPGRVYVVYLPSGGTAELDLGDRDREYAVRWYNPRTGGDLRAGSVETVRGPGRQRLGRPPAEPEADWAILIR